MRLGLTHAAAGLLAAALVAAPMGAQIPFASGSARIAGAVMTTDEPAVPVRRAVVTLRTGRDTRSEITDDQGRFAFDNLPAGRFELVARRASFVDAEFGARRVGGRGTPIALGAGERLDDVTIRIARGAVVTGAVRTPAGEPVVGVQVRAVATDAQIGLIIPGRDPGVFSDDRGVFRIHGLAPGRYHVVALPDREAGGTLDAPDRSMVDAMLAELRRGTTGVAPVGGSPAAPRPAATPAPTSPATFTWAPVFHPATTIRPDALELRLAAGEVRAGVDITMALTPTATLSGRITGDVSAGLTLMISGAGTPVPIGISPPVLTERVGADGAFRYKNVTPGRYVLTARTRGDDAAFATASVDVNGENVDGIVLSLRPALAMSGRITFEGGMPGGIDDLTPIRISMQPVDGLGSGGGVALMNNTNFGRHVAAAGQLLDDGSFRIPGVLPDVYHPTYVDSAGVVPAGWWLRSVMLDGRDLLDHPLEMADRDVDGIVFVFSNRHSELSGTLTSESGTPAIGYDVVVLPADRSMWRHGARRMRSTQPSTDGRFVFTDLPGGDYLLAVLTDLQPGDLDDMSFVEQVAAAGVPVRVVDGETTVQHLRGGR